MNQGVPDRIFSAVVQGRPEEVEEWLASLASPRDVVNGWQSMQNVWNTARRSNEPWRRKLYADPHFITIKAQIDGVHAHGSWRAYIMAPRLEVLTLRGLANRGKIRSTDPALNNLVALPNELICQVLAFWFG